jgi:hypothetical protein
MPDETVLPLRPAASDSAPPTFEAQPDRPDAGRPPSLPRPARRRGNKPGCMPLLTNTPIWVQCQSGHSVPLRWKAMAERKTKPRVRAMTTGKAPEPATICDQLRQAIQDSGKTHYRIGKDAGVKPEMVSRFARSERDVRAETFAKICIALGLRLTGPGLDKKE